MKIIEINAERRSIAIRNGFPGTMPWYWVETLPRRDQERLKALNVEWVKANIEEIVMSDAEASAEA